jgi:hypothetical protein
MALTLAFDLLLVSITVLTRLKPKGSISRSLLPTIKTLFHEQTLPEKTLSQGILLATGESAALGFSRTGFGWPRRSVSMKQQSSVNFGTERW